ncbi:MAG TPA: universal stress protein [Bradyrhizobium sp.]|nr:universal stress protein [Bradyrhizobium sp.]
MIKDIILKLECGESRDRALDYAVSIAETLDAHLAGVAFGNGPVLADFPMMDIPSSILVEIQAETEKAARGAIARFEEAARRSLLSAEPRLITQSELGDPPTAFSAMARRFDLSVIMQSDDNGVYNDLLIGATLFDSGRPVIIVPYIQKDGLKLDRVVCCWDGGRAAARALNDALPLLKEAQTVELFIVDNEKTSKESEIRGVGIADHLARHDVKVEVTVVSAPDIEVADAILSHVADCSADMIVMGGYGHSRFREFVLGGVTRAILSSMTVPVFISH